MSSSTGRPARVALGTGCLLVALAGCGVAERVEQEAGEATSRTVERAVEQRLQQELDRAGVALVAPPECTADVDLSALAAGAQGDVECRGETEQGNAAVARFSGTLRADGSCDGRLVVTVDGEERLDVPGAVCGGG